MKFFTASALLAAALTSAVVTVPFVPAVQPQPAVFFVEARLSASVDAAVKIYFDIGHGYSETESVRRMVPRGAPPRLYRFVLPPGLYRSLRFDPVEGAGTVTLHGPLRIVSETGRALRAIPLRALRPLEQIAAARENGDQLEMETTRDATDPQLEMELSPELPLTVNAAELAREVARRAWQVSAGFALLLFALDRLPRVRETAARVGAWLWRGPNRAVAVVALGAVIASAYPVIFLGKSLVSPNFGYLLYEAQPTLPGQKSGVVPVMNGTDLGPALWQNVPYAFVERRALGRGELPLWNRYALAGAPLLAQGQSMFGDPLHLLVLAANSAAWAWDAKYLIAKWLFAAGLGWTGLAHATTNVGNIKDATERRPYLAAALIVAAAAPFVGFFAYRVNHPAYFSQCYAPWVLLAWIRVTHARGRRAVGGWLAGLFLANLALLNSGAVKDAVLLLAQMNLAGAAVLLTSSAPWRTRLATLAGTAWAGMLVLLASAPMWATFLETLSHAFTVSTGTTADQIQPGLLLGAFDELFYRPLSRDDVVFNPSLNFLILLGLLYFLATLRQHLAHRAALVLAASAALATALAFGVVPPAWISRVPFLANVSHIDDCFSGGLIVLGAVLAGVGFATAARRLATVEGRGDLLVTALLLGALVAAWIGFRQAAHRELYGPGTTFSPLHRGETIPVNRFVWSSLAALLFAGAGLACVARLALRRRLLTPAAAILAALCVTVLLWRHGLHAEAVGFDTYVVQPPPRGRFDGRSPAVEFVQTSHPREPGRVFGVHGNLTPNWNSVYGLEAIHGPDALQNAWLRQLIDVSPVKWNSTWRVYVTSRELAAARPFFDALNVRYYLDLAGNPPPDDPGLTLAHRADLDVYESRTAWPRAFLANAVITYTDPSDLMKKILASEGRPFAALTREDLRAQPTLSRLATTSAAPVITPASGYRLTENTTSFDVHATAPGLAVLNEAWWPGSFRAEVNGRRAPVVRVNHAFKGVAIPAAGDYRVTFSYWPKNFTRSLVLCGLGVALLALSLVFALRPARPA